MRLFVSRSGQVRRSWLALCCVALVAVVDGGTGNPAAAYAADGALQRIYEVKHSVFSDIGTYTNLIEKSGPVTRIKTTAHFLVKALGVSMHREDAERVETWQGDRLVSFEGV